MGEGPLGRLQLLDHAAIQLGLALVLGGWASARWLAGADSSWSARCAAGAVQAARAGGSMGVLALAAAAWLEAASMAEVPLSQAGAAVLTLLRDTHYGHVGLIGFAAWCTVAAVAWGGRAGNAVLPGLLVTAWSRSAVSHAAKGGDGSFDVAIDLVHVVVTSLWVGTVIVAARLSRPSLAMSDRLDASRWVRALSSYATAALAAAILTGAFKIYRAVPDASLLPHSDYGRALFVKLGLVGAAVLLGGYNRFRVLPALQGALEQRSGSSPDPKWYRRLLTVVRIEMVVLVLVVGWAAVLSATEPPARTCGASSQPQQLADVAEGC